MTTEEIEKAGWEYANKSIDETTEIPKDIEQIRSYAVTDFMEGAEFADRHWIEKTAWRDLLDVFPPEGKAIIFKFTQNVEKVHCRLGFIGLGFILLDRGDSLSERHAKELGTFWKEIE